MSFSLILTNSCKKDEDTDNQISDADGNIYSSVKIGTQVWMVENLKTTKYNDGATIPLISDNTTWKNSTDGAYCWYNNDINNKGSFGALYNWYAVNKGKLCPAGWHVPSQSDYTAFIDFLGGESVAGGKLKTIGTIEDGNGLWYQPNVDATNEYEFSALPGGMRGGGAGNFSDLNYGGVWWSSTESTSDNSIYLYINNFDATFFNGVTTKKAGFSVRCLKN